MRLQILIRGGARQLSEGLEMRDRLVLVHVSIDRWVLLHKETESELPARLSITVEESAEHAQVDGKREDARQHADSRDGGGMASHGLEQREEEEQGQ